MDRSKLYDYSDGSRFTNKNVKDVFTLIEKENIWQQNESVSGIGSTLGQTEKIIDELPTIFRKLNIRTIFDIPCGDFNWFKEIDLSNYYYLGGDIVEDIVFRNINNYKSNNINFVQFDILQDNVESMDLIFCRDCLVHFSITDIWKALECIKKSNSRYLMTTTFTNQEKNNDTITGGWRPLNFMKSPFKFPEPVLIVNEGCTEMDGIFSDKSLAVWEIKYL